MGRARGDGPSHRPLRGDRCFGEYEQSSRGQLVELIENGAFFDEIRSAIRGASSNVHFETFLWKSGELSASLVEVFCERAKAGVAVRMIIDAEGGKAMSEAERTTLRDAGVQTCFVHPRNWRHIGTYNIRDHRKLLVVDARVAFVGGHCVTDRWRGDARGPDEVRDLSVRVRGPIVNDLQMVFSENWTSVTQVLLADPALYPAQEAAGDVRMSSVFQQIERRVSPVKGLHMMAVASATESITIQNPYFIPDDGMKAALCDAIARGVKVRVMTPALSATDNELPFRAMRDGVRPLLEAGVEVFTYTPTLLHQKVLVVDGRWSLIGSVNFDFRSFEINDEVTLSVFDETFGATLGDCFEADLKRCEALRVEDVTRRSFIARFKDRLAWGVRAQL